MQEEDIINTSITIPRTLYERIRKLAEADERSISYTIRKGMQIFLDTQAEPQPPTAPREKGKAK